MAAHQPGKGYTDSQILKAFFGTHCHACDGKKPPRNGFCRHCYHRLPERLSKPLWRRFGEGFEGAWRDALDFLREHL